MAMLSEKANEGELTATETDELGTYVLVNDLLSIVRSRASASLRGSQSNK
jgi:hypothetical protein